MPNPFDVFDQQAGGGNPFDAFDDAPGRVIPSISDALASAEPVRAPEVLLPAASNPGMGAPANIAEALMESLGVRDTAIGRGIQETGRTIGGGLEDAAKGALNFPADIVNALIAAPEMAGIETTDYRFDRLGDAVLPQTLPQPDQTINQILRPLVQFGTGFAGARSATANIAKETPDALRALVQGAVGDTVVSTPEEANLSNVINEQFGTNIPLAKVEGEDPLVGRLKDAAEGGILGVLTDVGLTSLARLMSKTRSGKPLSEVTIDEVSDAAAAGDADALDVLRDVGFSDEQLASLSPGRAQEFAGMVGERRAAEAAALDPDRIDGPVSRQDRARELGSREGKGRASQTELASAEAGAVVERGRDAAQRLDDLQGEVDAARVAGIDETELARLESELAQLQSLRRTAAPETIPVTPQGQGIAGTADEAAQAAVVRDRNKNLPAVTEPQPTRLTDSEVRAARRQIDGGNRNAAGVDGPLAAPEGRAPQTRDDLQAQREAEGAFDLADRQRGRVEEGVRDTRSAGRPEGGIESQQTIQLDEGRPVRILDERLVPDTSGRMQVVARVEQYDPRTGQKTGEPYEVARRDLTSGNYAPEPRRAQEFEQASQGPFTRAQEREAGLDRQTFRATEPDPIPTPQGEGDFDVRSPRPDQGEGPDVDAPSGGRGANQRGPFTSAEEIFRDFQRRQEEAAQGRADEAGARAEDRYRGAKANNTGAKADDGRWSVDEDGYVMSTAKGPVRFPDQKQAGGWILNKGQKESPDQIFEIANHPSGQGFTVRERGRAEAPPGDGARADAARPEGDGLKDAPEELRLASNKLYSNPLDPEILADVARSIAGSRFGKRLTEVLKSTVAAIKEPTGALRTIPRAILYSADGRIRAIAKAYKSDTAEKIANQFFSQPGAKAKGAGRSFDEAVELRRTSRQNEIARVLNDISEDQMDQVGRLIRTPNAIRKGSKIGEAATGLIKMLREELAYLREAGVEVGEVKNGYLPRIVDSDIVQADPAEFVKSAESYFRSQLRMSGTEARDAALDWANRIMGIKTDVQGDFAKLPSSHSPVFTKGRKLPDGVDVKGPLAKFYISDPRELLGAYVGQSARRAEWARRMGPRLEKWQELKASLIDDGLPPQAIDEIMQSVSTIGGTMGNTVSAAARRWMGWARVWNTIGLLEKATLSSIQEIAMPAIRSGNVKAIGRGIYDTVKDLTLGLHKSGDAQKMREFAEDFGMIVNNSFQTMSAVRFAGMEPASKKQGEVLDRYFRRIGLEQLTRATRMAAINQGSIFIRRLALDHAGGDKLSKSFLAELGVEPDKLDAFAKFVSDNAHSGSIISPDIIKGAGETGQAYVTAINRFMDQSVMRPSAATRPNWASHPVGSMVFQLQAFLYAFQKNAINRTLSLAKRGVSEKGLNLRERMRLTAPAAMMAILPFIAYGVGEVRDTIFGDPKRRREETGSDKVLKAISRSGITGALDPWVNIFTGVKYNRSVAQTGAGPLVGRGLDLVDTFARQAVRNSENTNTAERASARLIYDLMLEPALNLALTRAPLPAGAVATQAAGAGMTREQFITWLAGPSNAKRGPKSEGGIKPLPTR